MARLSPTSARPLLELGHEERRLLTRAPTRASLSLSRRTESEGSYVDDDE